MNLEFFILGGHGQFVWSAYIFAFVSCFVLYLKTKKKFKKYEKIFLNQFGQTQTVKIEIIKEKETAKKALSGNSIY